MCSVKANRSAHSGSVEKWKACVKESFFAAWHTYLLLQLWGRCTLYAGIHDPTRKAAALCFSVHSLVGERHTPAAVTHSRTLARCLWGTALACSLKIDMEKKKALTAAEPCFSAASGYEDQRGFAATGWDVTLWTGRGAEWLSCSSVASFYFFLSVSFRIHLSPKYLT